MLLTTSDSCSSDTPRETSRSPHCSEYETAPKNAGTCIGLHEATQVSALKPHSFIVIAKKVIVIVNVIVNFAISLLLIIGGFLLPPMGIIDGSVLTAVGELLMFGVLAQQPALISAAKNGKIIKLTKGDFTAEVLSSQGQGTGS